MGKSVEITLYHVSWCGHCVRFKNEKTKELKGGEKISSWNLIKKYVEDGDNEHKGVKIKLSESDGDNDSNQTINNEPVTGYPTLKFTVTNGNVSKEYNYSDYVGKRDPKVLLTFLKNVCEELSNA